MNLDFDVLVVTVSRDRLGEAELDRKIPQDVELLERLDGVQRFDIESVTRWLRDVVAGEEGLLDLR